MESIVISTNSTTTTLASGATFTGDAHGTLGYSLVLVAVKTDHFLYQRSLDCLIRFLVDFLFLKSQI